jgi:hypothetical protein
MGEESEKEEENIIWGAGEMLAHEETEAEGNEKPNNQKENDELNSFKQESSSNDSVSSEYVPSDAETGGEEEEVSDKRKKLAFDVKHSFYKAKIPKSAFGNVSEQTNPQHQGNCLLLLPCSCPNCLNGMEEYCAEAKDGPSDCDSSTDSVQDMRESIERVVKIPNFSKAAYLQLLGYLCVDGFKFNVDHAVVELWELADMYLLEGLKLLCILVALESGLCKGNVCKILQEVEGLSRGWY